MGKPHRVRHKKKTGGGQGTNQYAVRGVAKEQPPKPVAPSSLMQQAVAPAAQPSRRTYDFSQVGRENDRPRASTFDMQVRRNEAMLREARQKERELKQQKRRADLAARFKNDNYNGALGDIQLVPTGDGNASFPVIPTIHNSTRPDRQKSVRWLGSVRYTRHEVEAQPNKDWSAKDIAGLLGDKGLNRGIVHPLQRAEQQLRHLATIGILEESSTSYAEPTWRLAREPSEHKMRAYPVAAGWAAINTHDQRDRDWTLDSMADAIRESGYWHYEKDPSEEIEGIVNKLLKAEVIGYNREQNVYRILDKPPAPPEVKTTVASV